MLILPGIVYLLWCVIQLRRDSSRKKGSHSSLDGAPRSQVANLRPSIVHDSAKSTQTEINPKVSLQESSDTSSLWSSEFAPSPADPLAHLRCQAVTATPMPLTRAFTDLPGCHDLHVSELALRTEESDQGDVHALFIAPGPRSKAGCAASGEKYVRTSHMETWQFAESIPQQQKYRRESIGIKECVDDDEDEYDATLDQKTSRGYKDNSAEGDEFIPEVNEPEQGRHPVVICIHATTYSRIQMVPRMREMAKRGYLTVAIDSRYHGHRLKESAFPCINTDYKDALIQAWKVGDTRPFLFDTLWDIKCLVDYLLTRPDVDPKRIGITGISLGGMLSWLAASAIPQISVSVPMIGVQNFQWAIENNKWQGRVASVPGVFAKAAEDLGKTAVDAEVVSAVWGRVCPSLLSRWDAPLTLPRVAPRPMLILATDQDPACPIQGLEQPVQAARKAYASLGAEKNFRFHVERGIGHQINETMNRAADEWFDRFFA